MLSQVRSRSTNRRYWRGVAEQVVTYGMSRPRNVSSRRGFCMREAGQGSQTLACFAESLVPRDSREHVVFANVGAQVFLRTLRVVVHGWPLSFPVSPT